jgi:DnaK suppressor protein
MTKPTAPDVAIGRVSRMDAINNNSITEAALRTAEEKLSGLQYVLTKINEEKFGLCARCGNTIPMQRIILRPQSVHCVNCAY